MLTKTVFLLVWTRFTEKKVTRSSFLSCLACTWQRSNFLYTRRFFYTFTNIAVIVSNFALQYVVEVFIQSRGKQCTTCHMFLLSSIPKVYLVNSALRRGDLCYYETKLILTYQNIYSVHTTSHTFSTNSRFMTHVGFFSEVNHSYLSPYTW